MKGGVGMRSAARAWSTVAVSGLLLAGLFSPAGTAAAADSLAEDGYDGYVTVTDDTGALRVSVPEEWDDVDGAPYTGPDGLAYSDVRAAPDLEEFTDGWETPGVIVTASSALAQVSDEAQWLDELLAGLDEGCDYVGREPYDDGTYSGLADLFSNCGGTRTAYIVVAAAPADRSFLVRVQVQAVDERDVEALNEILRSFVVVGAV